MPGFEQGGSHYEFIARGDGLHSTPKRIEYALPVGKVSGFHSQVENLSQVDQVHDEPVLPASAGLKQNPNAIRLRLLALEPLHYGPRIKDAVRHRCRSAASSASRSS